MTKIITYTDRKGGFSRKADGTDDIVEKKKGKEDYTEERIYAEQELDELIKDGWQILSSSTYIVGSNILGSTVLSLTKLTIVLYKAT